MHTQIWTSVSIKTCRDISSLALRLERSANAMIDVSCKFTGPHKIRLTHCRHTRLSCTKSHPICPPGITRYFPLLYQNVNRLRSLSIIFDVTSDDSEAVKTFLSYLDGPFPHLQRLSLHGIGDLDPMVVPIEFMEDVPQTFRNLEFRGTGQWFPYLRELFCASTVSLVSLDVSTESFSSEEDCEIMDIMRDHSTTLERVRLYLPNSIHFHDLLADEIVHVPSLQHLTIRALGAPLDSFHAPNLQTFRIEFPMSVQDSTEGTSEPPLMTMSPQQQQLCRFLQSHSGTIKELFISGSIGFTVNGVMWPCINMPSLRSLAAHTNLSAARQSITIDAPLTHLMLLLDGDVASLEIWRLTNRYTNTLLFLLLDATLMTSIEFQEIPNDAPSPCSRLTSITMRLPLDYELSEDFIAGCSYTVSRLSRGKFKWDAIPLESHICLYGSRM